MDSRMTGPAILEHLDGVRHINGGWLARCPAHEDRSPSLSVGVGHDDRTLLTCFAGCATEDVVAALGLRMRDLAGDAVLGERIGHTWSPPATQAPLPDDFDQLGQVCHRAAQRLSGAAGDHPAVRYASTRFGVTVADMRRLGLGYADNMGGGGRLVVPFRNTWGVACGYQARALDPTASVRWLSPRSPQQGAWARLGWFEGPDADAPICVTEGPGDALTAVALGYHAIAIRGASNARHVETQRTVRAWVGRRFVIVCGDGDEAGARFSSDLVKALRAAGASVSALALDEGEDLTDRRSSDPEGCAEWMRSQSGRAGTLLSTSR